MQQKEKPSLMAHQVRGVKFGLERSNFALVMDRGTGKTPTVMSIIDHRMKHDGLEKVLYVAPLSTVKNVARESITWADRIRPAILVGARAKRVKMLKSPLHNMFIINFEGTRIMTRELLNMGFGMIVVDESTRIKDRRTQVARAMSIIGANTKYKATLTGMPFTEGVEDAWSQFHFLDPNILQQNYYVFRSKYCVLKDLRFGKGKRFKKITGYKEMDDFERRVMPHVYRVAKEDCLDLPPKLFQILRVRMLEAQAKQYATVKEETMSMIDGSTITHQQALAKIQKLRQVAAGFLYDNEHKPITVPCAKYQVLADLIDETLYGRKKMVIFTSFRAEPEMVKNVVEGLKKEVKVFMLPVKPLERQDEIDRWTEYPKPAVLIANARSGGTGLNLTAADTAVFISNDWRMEDREQAKDRIHRIGSEVFDKVTIVDIVTEDTVEELILEALDKKKNLVQMFLDRLRDSQNGKED